MTPRQYGTNADLLLKQPLNNKHKWKIITNLNIAWMKYNLKYHTFQPVMMC